MSDFNFTEFRDSDWVQRHCSNRNPQNPFHMPMEYPDDANRVMLVTGKLHRYIDTMESFAHIPVTERATLRKRLNLDTLALEVYDDKKFLITIPQDAWGNELAFIIKEECVCYLKGWCIY